MKADKRHAENRDFVVHETCSGLEVESQNARISPTIFSV